MDKTYKRINIGCGQTLIPGFINLDNSPSSLLAKLPGFALKWISNMRLISSIRYKFILTLKSKNVDFMYSNALNLPFPDNSIDFCYSSHMISWYLSIKQHRLFFEEVKRILKPGSGLRLSFSSLDRRIKDYEKDRDAITFLSQMPLGDREFDLKDKIKFLFEYNQQNGLVLNIETLSKMLLEAGFVDIKVLEAGESMFSQSERGEIDLFERKDQSTYLECLKG